MLLLVLVVQFGVGQVVLKLKLKLKFGIEVVYNMYQVKPVAFVYGPSQLCNVASI
jgi:hypothetical protein